jgi:hypothetical protein
LVAFLPAKRLDRFSYLLYNDFVVIDGDNIMIIRRETLNEIASMRYAGKSVEYIAAALGLLASDVAAALKAWKL